jgi:hypothetical protein
MKILRLNLQKCCVSSVLLVTGVWQWKDTLDDPVHRQHQELLPILGQIESPSNALPTATPTDGDLCVLI